MQLNGRSRHSWTAGFAAVALMLGMHAQSSHAAGERSLAADLEKGIQQYRDGAHADAVRTLGTLTERFATEKADATLRWNAYLYLAMSALAAPGQSARARPAMREALKIDPSMQLPAAEYPSQVRQLLDNVRSEGRSGHKKALIYGGGALAAGGAAVVAFSLLSNQDEKLSATVGGLGSTGPGSITFLSADPPPGSVRGGCGAGLHGCVITMTFNVVTPEGDRTTYGFDVILRTDLPACRFSNNVLGPPPSVFGSGTQQVTVQLAASGCPMASIRVTGMSAELGATLFGFQDIAATWTIGYLFKP
jgi:hypothetical protein